MEQEICNLMTFHEIRFPTNISLASEGGPERRTEIVTLGSGHEERNSRWADSRRSYNAGYGIKSLDELYVVTEFYEERRGRLYGFRWKDYQDFKSCAPLSQISPEDQVIGTGDGSSISFQLSKTYGGAYAPYIREIKKPVSGTVQVSVNASLQQAGVDYTIDDSTGVITFFAGHIPSYGEVITAGFEFDVPVRFDTDKLSIDITKFRAGSIPNIPVIEVRL